MKSFFAYIFIAIVIVGVFVPTKFVYGGVESEIAVLTAKMALSGTVCSVSLSPSGLVNCFFGLMGFLLLKISSLLLGIGGWLLNYSIKWTIIDWTKNVGQMTGINIAWKFIRDLMNICFIFFLVYYSIKLIIGQETRQHIYKFIGMIVLVSLLINFSLFITKVIIDASNVATIGMYQTILGNQKDPDVGLSDAYQQNLGLTNFYKGSGFESFSQANGNSGQAMFMIGIFGSILFIITAFVFFAVSIMFLLRYLILIFLLMFAAVGFMGLVVPGMKKYANEWWDTLIGQCLFGPIYMIITWVILTLIASPGFITKNGAAASWVGLFIDPKPTTTAGVQPAIELLINFALIIGLTVMALTVSKSASQRGSSMVSKFGGKLTAFAGGAVLGGSAVALRQTMGRAGNALANSEKLKNAKSKGGFGGWVAGRTMSVGNKAASGSFDVRSSKVGGLIQDGFGKGQGVNLGKGANAKQVSFQAQQKARADAAKKRGEALKPSEQAIADAKTTLQSKEFKNREEQRKAEHDVEYKNSDQYKQKSDLEKANAEDSVKLKNINTDQEKLEKLRRERDSQSDPTRKALIASEVKKMEAEENKRMAERTELKKMMEDRQKIIDKIAQDEKSWMSKEYKSLVAIAGGTEKLNKDKTLNIEKIEQPIEDAHKQRVEAMAQREENAGKFWRYSAQVFGTPLNIITGGMIPIPKTKSDRQAIARSYRSAARGKTAEQEAKDLLKKMRKEAKERGEKFDDEEEEKSNETKQEAAPQENKVA